MQIKVLLESKIVHIKL